MLITRPAEGITQQQIANAMGVSRQLVSHALHGTRSSRISPDTRREIRHQACLMGDLPRNRTAYTVGFVTPLESQLLAGESRFMVMVGQALRLAGYRIMLQNLQKPDGNSEPLSETLNAKVVGSGRPSLLHAGGNGRLHQPRVVLR